MPTNDSKPLFRTGSHAVFLDERPGPGPENRRSLEVLHESRDREGRAFWEREYDNGVVAEVLGEMALSFTPQSPSNMMAVLAAARALVLATTPTIVASSDTYGTGLGVRPNDKHDAHSLHKALREALGISREEWEAARDGKPLTPPLDPADNIAFGPTRSQIAANPDQYARTVEAMRLAGYPASRFTCPPASPAPSASFEGRVGSALRGVLVRVRAGHDAITLDVSNGRDGASGYTALLTAVDAGVLSGHLADAARFVREGPGAFLQAPPASIAAHREDERETCPHAIQGGAMGGAYCTRPWCGVCARNRQRDGAPTFEQELLRERRSGETPPPPPAALTHERVAELHGMFGEYAAPGTGTIRRLTRGELDELCETWKAYHSVAAPSREGGPWQLVSSQTRTFDERGLRELTETDGSGSVVTRLVRETP